MLQGAGRGWQSGRSTTEARALRSPDRIWVLGLLICTLLAALSFAYIDVPVARLVYGCFGSAKSLATGLGSMVLLGIESAVALALILLRLKRGRLSPFGEATGLACLTSICAYTINDSVLKHFFGVPNPAAVVEGARHAFSFFNGTPNSSFPSGHMVLASSFAGVFLRLNPKSARLLWTLLAIGAALLIVGDWHFISDVIAGTFIGVSTGLLAGEVWLAHSR